MFTLKWTVGAQADFDEIRTKAERSVQARQKNKRAKATRDEALFKKVVKCLNHLHNNPKHPGLQTHEFESLSTNELKVLESYVENQTPGAYRIFWHYGPDKSELTILAIVPHP